ncbi:hypothetical protein [Litorivivens sp.]|uniref:hypothetical protein n=1 Tax=Litorivivens sp. TaxID=2020868 RepID=UPI0035655D1F
MFQQLPEGKRLAYLDAMGVESFFPRIALPGAPPPVLCETLPEPVTTDAGPPAAGVEPVSVRPATSAAPEINREALLKDLLPREKSAPTAAVTKPATAEAKPQERLQFTLRFYQVAGLAMIVDSSPAATPEPAIVRFTANLLLAISRLDGEWEGSIKDSLHHHLFRWPLVGNAQIEQGATAAREAVTAAVQANCERHAIPRILLLGEQAADFGAGDYSHCRVLSSHSVSHFLMNPLAKRALWQSLQAWG